ncbi:hypothetical protein BTUL_0009g00730 [Botrytis tulipae]|uniref:Uncharacterized protein n=1 Tax=Botrytis tulipae TaxID=87230 RepID=A0A4Z1F1S3_9HELO|nr:hypothetical protein BTUL_0009g00730 [Botrytis tulipae]
MHDQMLFLPNYTFPLKQGITIGIDSTRKPLHSMPPSPSPNDPTQPGPDPPYMNPKTRNISPHSATTRDAQ